MIIIRANICYRIAPGKNSPSINFLTTRFPMLCSCEQGTRASFRRNPQLKNIFPNNSRDQWDSNVRKRLEYGQYYGAQIAISKIDLIISAHNQRLSK